MFYSETLLSKTGPLARVWLSANLERKLSKSHILQSDIESSVNAIVDQGQAPMALRLSGQLLLGVVRIYSRKTRYLLDDCNEALMKIKMVCLCSLGGKSSSALLFCLHQLTPFLLQQAFRLTNNNDLSSSVVLPSGSLTLPDVLTESDLFTNLDPSILFSQSATPAVKPPLSSAGWSSNLLTDSQSIPARKDPVPSELPHLEDDTGLVLDLGEDEYPLGHDPDMSIEVGRDAPAPRPVGEDLFSDQPFDGDLDLDLGEGNNAGINKSSVLGDKDHDDLDNFLLQNDESRLEDTVMGGMDDPATAALAEDSTILPADEDIERQRTMSRSASPLSEARSSVVRELEETFVDNENENESAAAPQRVKRRRLLHADEATFISKEQLKQQREDRSKILKPSSDLPRDLVLLTLTSMQRGGAFVSSVMEDNVYIQTPQLRDLLTATSAQKAGELKRKRAGSTDAFGQENEDQSLPQLDINLDESMINENAPANESILNQHLSSEIDIPADEEHEGVRAQFQGEDDQAMEAQEARSEREESALPPVEPISVGTEHAAGLLREHLGHKDSADSQVIFQDLFPEQTTSRADATKMFFEVLVLATKDAIAVEQDTEKIGGTLKVTAKNALWNSRTDFDVTGEAETQSHMAAPILA